MNLPSRPVLVTGSGSGIGRSTALRLANRGFAVAVTDKDEKAARQVSREIAVEGGVATHAPLDVTDSASVREAVDACANDLGGLGGLVNNAGWTRNIPLLEQDDEYIAQILEINIAGTIRVSREVVPLLRRWGSGRVVNVASDSARIGMSNGAAYTSAKGGVLALSRSLARELARDDITVNCVSPGVIDTPLYADSMAGSSTSDKLLRTIPLRRLGSPEDVAAAIAFFIGDDAAYITGQTLSVSGGMVII